MWRVWKSTSLGTKVAQSVKCLLSRSKDQSLIPRRHKALCGDAHLHWENRKRGYPRAGHHLTAPDRVQGGKGPLDRRERYPEDISLYLFLAAEGMCPSEGRVMLPYNQGC